MIEWLRTVRTPVTICLANEGFVSQFREEDREEWINLGWDWVFPGQHIFHFDANVTGISWTAFGVAEIL
jgi:hypothetical protein